jgi:hypothetical protein
MQTDESLRPWLSIQNKLADQNMRMGSCQITVEVLAARKIFTEFDLLSLHLSQAARTDL